MKGFWVSLRLITMNYRDFGFLHVPVGGGVRPKENPNM